MANYLPEDLTVLSCSCPRCVLYIFFRSPSNSQQSYLRSDSAYICSQLPAAIDQNVSENMRNDHFCRSRPIDNGKNYCRGRKISFLIDWFMTYRRRPCPSREWNFENRWQKWNSDRAIGIRRRRRQKKPPRNFSYAYIPRRTMVVIIFEDNFFHHNFFFLQPARLRLFIQNSCRKLQFFCPSDHVRKLRACPYTYINDMR